MLTKNEALTKIEDGRFAENESNASFQNHLFIRLIAKERTFTKINFRYCTFDACYLRNCKFLQCDFTGCRFVSSSFSGSSFSQCRFDYASFDKTQIAPDILFTQTPNYENVTERFARTLRVNYQQLGDARAANEAIKVELAATRTHLLESWLCRKGYYQGKFKGPKQISAFIKWLSFVIQDALWGNGESAARLLVSLLALFVLMAFYHACKVPNGTQIDAFRAGLRVSPSVYLGIKTFPQYSGWYLPVVTALRLISVAALTSILIKRLGRR